MLSEDVVETQTWWQRLKISGTLQFLNFKYSLKILSNKNIFWCLKTIIGTYFGYNYCINDEKNQRYVKISPKIAMSSWVCVNFHQKCFSEYFQTRFLSAPCSLRDFSLFFVSVAQFSVSLCCSFAVSIFFVARGDGSFTSSRLKFVKNPKVWLKKII